MFILRLADGIITNNLKNEIGFYCGSFVFVLVCLEQISLSLKQSKYIPYVVYF